METYTLTHRPPDLIPHRKRTTVALALVSLPFCVETQEGMLTISAETVEDSEGGYYYVAFPDDGSKPYPISPSFVRQNYVMALHTVPAQGV